MTKCQDFLNIVVLKFKVQQSAEKGIPEGLLQRRDVILEKNVSMFCRGA